MTDAQIVARALCKLRGFHEQEKVEWYRVPLYKEACDDCHDILGDGSRRIKAYDAKLTVRWPA